MGAPPMNLFDGRIEAGAVRVNGGTALAPSTHDDRPVTVGIRPEDVEINAGGELDFDIEIVEELGAHRLLHGHLGGQAFTVHVGKEVEAHRAGQSCP